MWRADVEGRYCVRRTALWVANQRVFLSAHPQRGPWRRRASGPSADASVARDVGSCESGPVARTHAHGGDRASGAPRVSPSANSASCRPALGSGQALQLRSPQGDRPFVSDWLRFNLPCVFGSVKGGLGLPVNSGICSLKETKPRTRATLEFLNHRCDLGHVIS